MATEKYAHSMSEQEFVHRIIKDEYVYLIGEC